MITELGVVVGGLVATLVGWSVGGWVGATIGLAVAGAVGVIPWWGLPAWRWLLLWWRRNRSFDWPEPVTVSNDRTAAGVRYHDGVAAVAVHVLGRPHRVTLCSGSTVTETADTLDVVELLPMLRQSLGLTITSISVVSAGARRAVAGGYPALYDTLIGTPPYAGRRETWLVVRIAALDNADALRWRTSVGAAAVAAGQRVAAALRECGIRARVGSAREITEWERRLDRSALRPGNRRWRALRGESGWLTSYAYPGPVSAEKLSRAWSLRVDGVIQHVTVYPDGTATGTVTVRTAHPLPAPPSVLLRAMPGQQAGALAATRCGPAPMLVGVARRSVPDALLIPVGPSGVLLGKLSGGRRLMLPVIDPAGPSRNHIAADDAVTKRVLVRLAGSGERITIHTTDLQRWSSLRMPGITLTDAARPSADGTISVIDGTIPAAPRSTTLLVVGEYGTDPPDSADVSIAQTGPATLAVTAAGAGYEVGVELFRAENRYVVAHAPPAAAQRARCVR